MSTIHLNHIDDYQMKRNFLNSFDVILFDCDGVLWHDDVVISDAPETVNTLQALGKKVYFVTNNGTKTRHQLCQKALTMNFNIKETQIIAPTFSIAQYLKVHLKKDQKVYVIGTEAMGKELSSLNIQHFGMGPDTVQAKWVDVLAEIDQQAKSENIGAVVVSFDDQFSYNKMIKACNFLGDQEGKCLFLATNADAVSKFPHYCIPGTGAILKAIETCVGREALIMGKPNPMVCEHLLRTGEIKAERTLMVGDCYKADVVFGKNCGFSTLLVGTGRYKWSDVEELVKNGSSEYIPNYYISSVGDLKTFL